MNEVELKANPRLNLVHVIQTRTPHKTPLTSMFLRDRGESDASGKLTLPSVSYSALPSVVSATSLQDLMITS